MCLRRQQATVFGRSQESRASGAVDKKLLPLLQPGDSIQSKCDCERVLVRIVRVCQYVPAEVWLQGMDTVPGLLMVGAECLYVVDNYRLNARLRQSGGVRAAGAVRPSLSPRGHAAASNVSSSGGAVAPEEFVLDEDEVVEVAGPLPPLCNPERPPEMATPRSHLIGGAERASSVSGNDKTAVIDHTVARWPYTLVVAAHKRRYLLRHIALELFASDGRTGLIVFESSAARDLVFDVLARECPPVLAAAGTGAAAGLARVTGVDALASVMQRQIKGATARWQSGELSNFGYLMALNTFAGRSYNDFTQYPVFPWVLADYDSEDLDLGAHGWTVFVYPAYCFWGAESAATFRDLSKPMGALNEAAAEMLKERYDSLANPGP